MSPPFRSADLHRYPRNLSLIRCSFMGRMGEIRTKKVRLITNFPFEQKRKPYHRLYPGNRSTGNTESANSLPADCRLLLFLSTTQNVHGLVV